MKLQNLLPPYGRKHKRKRVGRGNSSGHGNYSGRGLTGEGSRAGRVHYVGFEGGQMPLYRRLPKRGFNPLTRVRYQEVNLYSLNDFKKEKEITPELLCKKGLIKKADGRVKILGKGTLEVSVTVKAHKFSKKAKEEITQKGGSAVEISACEEGKPSKAPIKEKKTEDFKVEKTATGHTAKKTGTSKVKKTAKGEVKTKTSKPKKKA